MAADAMDSSLVSQCLAFCQTLASQGKDFSFSLNINSSFSFSLDTRESKVKQLWKRSGQALQPRGGMLEEEKSSWKRNSTFPPLSSSALDAPVDISPATTVAAATSTSSPLVASTPATLPSPPSKQVANQDYDTVSEELEEDIPELVPKSECDTRLSVFRKSFSTPPKKVMHSVHGVGLFQRITALCVRPLN